MGRRFLTRVALVVGLALTIGANSASAQDRYYAIVFGSQSRPKLLRYTHTWATFVHVVGDENDPAGCVIYQNTISWLPESLNVKTWSIFPEKGINLDLHPTFEAVLKNRENVTMWGPFEIKGEVYERSLKVRSILDSGQAQYRAISTPRNILVSDCIHAVAAVDPVFGRGHYPLIRVGQPASRFLAREVVIRSVYDQYQTEATWLIPRLGLDRYPLQVVQPRQIPKQQCFLCRIPE